MNKVRFSTKSNILKEGNYVYFKTQGDKGDGPEDSVYLVDGFMADGRPWLIDSKGDLGHYRHKNHPCWKTDWRKAKQKEKRAFKRKLRLETEKLLNYGWY